MEYNKLPKYVFSALIGVASLQPAAAGATNCIGNVVNWTQTSNAFCFPNVSSKSVGTNSGTIPPSNFRLTATLISGGIHGTAIAYGVGTVPLPNCFPVDSTPGNGGVTDGIGTADCLGGTRHQAVAVF